MHRLVTLSLYHEHMNLHKGNFHFTQKWDVPIQNSCIYCPHPHQICGDITQKVWPLLDSADICASHNRGHIGLVATCRRHPASKDKVNHMTLLPSKSLPYKVTLAPLFCC